MKSEELPDIRSGMQVDVVVSSDYQKEIKDVRRAVVYETAEGTAVLSQPTPPFTRFYLNREMLITYLVYPHDAVRGGQGLEGAQAGGPPETADSRDPQEPMRVGVFAKLVNIIPYRAADSVNRDQAVVMALRSGTELKNLRSHIRVRPMSDQNVEVYFEGERMNVIDISIGGAMLSRKEELPVNLSEPVKVVVVVEGEVFNLKARIVRVWSSYIDKRNGREHISVQFLNMNKRLNYLLGAKVFGIK